MSTLADFANALTLFAHDNPDWIVLIVFVLAFFEFVPLVWVFLLGVAALVGPSDPARLWLVIGAAAFGGAAGDALLYGLGRANRDRVGAIWPLRKHPKIVEKTQRFFERWGVWAVVVGRFSGPIRFSVPVVAGAMHMRYAPFQLGAFASALVAAIVLFWPAAWGASWLLGAVR